MNSTIIFLQECGLSPLPSRVLSLLFYSDGMTARQISEITCIAKQNLYPVLDNLESKNLAVSIPSRPKVYRTNPEVAIKNLIEKQESRISFMMRERKEQLRMIRVARREAKKCLTK